MLLGFVSAMFHYVLCFMLLVCFVVIAIVVVIDRYYSVFYKNMLQTVTMFSNNNCVDFSE